MIASSACRGVALATACFTLAGRTLDAQDSIRIEGLRPPASPAFVLLGVAPTLVERPTSPRALVVSLLSASTGNTDNVLPKEYALEVAPYWLVSHPTLTYEGYYHPSVAQALLQTLAFSLGTTPLPDTIVGGTAMGLGIRTQVIPGQPHPDLAAHERTLRAIQDTMVHISGAAEVEIDSLLKGLEDSVLALHLASDREEALLDSLTSARTASHDAEVAQRLRPYENAARNVALAMQDLDKDRVGWQLELAGAVVLDFPGTLVDNGRVGRIGVWASVARRLSGPHLDLVAVARYRHDRRSTPARELFDFGSRLVWEAKRLSVSGELLEYVGDDIDGTPPGHRLAMNLEYRVGAWGTLTATLATDDAPENAGRQRIVTFLGLNLGFGVLPLLVGSR